MSDNDFKTAMNNLNKKIAKQRAVVINTTSLSERLEAMKAVKYLCDERDSLIARHCGADGA